MQPRREMGFAVVYFARTASVAAFIKENSPLRARFRSVFPRESFNFQRRNNVSAPRE